MAETFCEPHNRIRYISRIPSAGLPGGREVTMFRGSYPWFKVVHRKKKEYAVWHSEAKVLTEWRETGRYGSVDECWDYIETKEGSRGFLFKFEDT
jgi:uncharacterized protein YbdZ (MbtH family)